MSLAHAILGFLNHQPMTGYDLKTEAFDQSVAYFWKADQTQIYRTLDKLAEQGYVASHIEFQESRPNRKVYTITDTGRAELIRWLHTFQPAPQVREAFLIQIFFGGQLSDAELLNNLERQAVYHREVLKVYETITLPPADASDLDRDLMLQRFTLDFGVRFEQAYLDWIAQCIRVIQDRQRKEAANITPRK